MLERTVFNAGEERTVFLPKKLGDNLVVLRVLSKESAQQQQASGPMRSPNRWARMRLGTGNSCDTSGNVMYLSLSVSHKLNSTRCSTKGKYSGGRVQTGHRSILFKVTTRG